MSVASIFDLDSLSGGEFIIQKLYYSTVHRYVMYHASFVVEGWNGLLLSRNLGESITRRDGLNFQMFCFGYIFSTKFCFFSSLTRTNVSYLDVSEELSNKLERLSQERYFLLLRT